MCSIFSASARALFDYTLVCNSLNHVAFRIVKYFVLVALFGLLFVSF